MYNTNAVVNTNYTANEARKLPEVQSEVEQLGYQLEHLDKVIEQLAEKLVPVLSNRAVDQAGGQSAPEPVRVPLAESLHQRCLLAQGITRRVEDLIGRVEL